MKRCTKSGSHQLTALEGSSLAELPVDRQEGRRVWIGGLEKIDFCSTNYLGLDQDRDLIEEGIRYARQWGVISNWSRFELDPVIYRDAEAEIGRLLEVQNVTLAHTITAAGFSLIPAIVGEGVLFVDAQLHTVVWEAARLARDHGATIVKFRHQDVEDLERKLADAPPSARKLICVDGVYSISAERAPIDRIQRLCQRYDAFVYVDDAHGFGVLGTRGAGVVEDAKCGYSRIIYVSSFNKAFCTHTAFSTQPEELKEKLRSRHLQHLFSAPISPFTLGTAMAALRINRERGAELRRSLAELSLRFRAGMRASGFDVDDRDPHPVVFVKAGNFETFQKFATRVFEAGVLAGIRTYPVVPPDSCGLRFAISASHSRADIDRAIEVCEGARPLLAASRSCA